MPARPERVRELTARAPFLYRASLNKWWFDDLYHLLFMVIGGRIAAAIWWFDREVIDGTVNAIGTGDDRRRPRPAPGPDRSGPELRPGHRHRPDRDGRVVPAAGGPLTMTVDSIPILTIIIFLPLARRAGGRHRCRPTAARPVALGVRARDLGRLALPARRLPARRPGFQFVETVDWIPIFGIQYKLGADGLSVALVVLTTTLSWISILASFKPIQTRIKEYMISFLDPRGRADRRLPRARHVPVLHLLGDRPRPDVPDHRDLGWREPDLRHDQVRPLHARRVAADARGDPGDGLRLPAGHGGSWVGAFDFEVLRAYAGTGGLRRRPPAPRLRGVLPGLRHQGPDVPVPHLAARRAHGGADGGLGDAGGDHAQAGRLRVHPVRGAALPGGGRRPSRR